MSAAHILVADDEEDLAWAIEKELSMRGYYVALAADGVSTLTALRHQRFDLVVLDIVMPRIDGLQVCYRLRDDPDLDKPPILFLTGCSEVEDRIQGFEAGADDYLVKPFDMKELVARIKALLRRSKGFQASSAPVETARDSIELGSLALDLRNRQAVSGKRAVQLTAVEFDLLKYLMENSDEVHSSRKLLHEVWSFPEDAIETSLVRWHVKNLRAKIEPDPASPVYIHTVPHQGYILQTCERSN